MPSQSPWLLIAKLSALNQQQRFYELRFMWTVISALEKLGVPTHDIEEMRGIYQSFADGVEFSDHINQQKGTDSASQPQGS